MNINDDSDGTTHFDISIPVVVRPNAALIGNLTNSLLSNSNSDFIASITSGGVQAATSFISLLTSSLDTRTTNEVNLAYIKSYNNIKLVNFLKTNEKNSQIKEVLVNVTASLPITDVNSVLLISNTMFFLTNNPNEISLGASVIIKFRLKIIVLIILF